MTKLYIDFLIDLLKKSGRQLFDNQPAIRQVSDCLTL
ncbi:MAG: hypothetical protein JWP37_2894 [Mucilaginibacter sp.]|nr:hypothetical protein [Mucilaginibacter sp.]